MFILMFSLLCLVSLTALRRGSRQSQPPASRAPPGPQGPWGVRAPLLNTTLGLLIGHEAPVQVDGLGPGLLAVRGLVHHAEVVLGAGVEGEVTS